MRTAAVTLTADIWRSLDRVLDDFQTFGPGDMSSEYVPDEHLAEARKAIAKAVASLGLDLREMGSSKGYQ